MADKTDKNKDIEEVKKCEQKQAQAEIELEEQNPQNPDDSDQEPEEGVGEGEEAQKDEMAVKLQKLEDEIACLKEKELRQFAEFDNFRKRTQKEKQDTYQNATADCVLDFLAVLDNLERALAAAADEDQLKSGVALIVSQFHELLAKMGVEEVQALGEEFNPVWHNAVNQVEDENYGENIICEVFQKGYRMGERAIRPAMVVVANP